MYEFLNLHPKGLRVGDCVKRAIALVAQMDYNQVSLELNRYKKVTGAREFSSDYNPHKYVENILKMKKLSFPAETGKARMNGERFCEKFPKGRYILNMANHWTACVDGIIYDTWDCTDKCVYTAYEMRSEEEIWQIIAEEEAVKKQIEERKAKEKAIRDKYNKEIDQYCYEIEKLQNKIAKLKLQKENDLEALKKEE